MQLDQVARRVVREGLVPPSTSSLTTTPAFRSSPIVAARSPIRTAKR
jgi:hypothetical protein